MIFACPHTFCHVVNVRIIKKPIKLDHSNSLQAETFRGECQDQTACPSFWLTADQPCWLTVRVLETPLSLPWPTAWSWGGSLTATPAGFGCLKAAVFADWTAGVVTPTPGGQLIHRLPRRVWVMVARHCRLHWAADRDELNPWRGERATTIRKMTVTLL